MRLHEISYKLVEYCVKGKLTSRDCLAPLFHEITNVILQVTIIITAKEILAQEMGNRHVRTLLLLNLNETRLAAWQKLGMQLSGKEKMAIFRQKSE